MSSMTILRGNQSQNDDQMVPEARFDVLAGDSGATVFQAQQQFQSLPDFDSLLKGLTSGLADSKALNSCLEEACKTLPTYMDTPVITTETDLNQFWDIEGQELSMYDDIPFTFQKEKLVLQVTAVDVQPEQTELIADLPSELTTIKVEPTTFAPIGATQTELYSTIESEFLLNDNMFDEEKQKIEYTCLMLNIPHDPYQWSNEQVQSWVAWYLQTYSLSLDFCEYFQMDGTTLCMMSLDDFRRRSPQAGDFLFAELDIWKNAFNMSCNVLENGCTIKEEPTYMDLSNAQPMSNILPLPSAIPTPVITATSMCSTSSQYPVTSSAQLMMSSSTMQQSPMLSSASVITKMVYSDVDEAMLQQRMVSPVSLSPAPSNDSLNSSMSSTLSGSSSFTGSLSQSSGWTTSNTSEEEESDEIEYKHRPRQTVNPGKHTIHLWQFLKDLLSQSHLQNAIRWLDRSKGIFKIEDSATVAKLWGKRKNRPAMNYDKLSRSIRQYYKKGIIKKTVQSKRLVYQFCSPYLATL